MKALVIWSSTDGTTQPMLIEGPYIVAQLWHSGALVSVYHRRGGQRLRDVHFARVALIDVDRTEGG